MRIRGLRAGRWPGMVRICLLLGLAGMFLGRLAAQSVTTTTVQGTVYLASGAPGSGTVLVSWPAFTTASNQEVAAGNLSVQIGSDGFLSVNLAPNLGANPAGLYYTAVFHLSDGTVNTEYWVVPAAASATLASVQAQLMPAAQAVQTVSKAYVDQAIAELAGSLLTANGGTLTGPLTLCCDPTTPLMAADKHYVDTVFAEVVPFTGGMLTGALSAPELNGVSSPVAGGAQSTLQETVTAAGTNGAMAIPPQYAGTDTFTNPSGIRVEDWRTGVAQQHERSVKEFGAVCNGVTDDTNALQAALNYAYAANSSGATTSGGVVLTLPAGTCKTQQLVWHGESIGGQGRQVSALMGFPGQDVLASPVDATGMLANTRLHDLTIYVDQSTDVSCTPAQGRAAAGSCGTNRPIETGSVFSPGGNGLTGTAGTGAGWEIGNCAIAMQAQSGTGGNGLQRAEIENVEIATVGTDPLGTYTQADSTHTCGMYLSQWPVNSEFRNIDIRGVGTGIAMPGLAVVTPAGLVADSNRWMNVSIQAVHGMVLSAGNNGVLDGVTLNAWNSAAVGETPTGLVLDFGAPQQGWSVRNALVQPEWVAVQPRLTVTASGGAVTAVTVGPEHGLGFEAYGPTVALGFSGSCTARANASVNSDGSLGTVTVTSGGVGCSSTTTANTAAESSANGVPAKAVNLISGTNVSFSAGNLLKGTGGYTVWNAASSRLSGTVMGGGGTQVASTSGYPALVVGLGAGTGAQANGNTGSANRFDALGLTGSLSDSGLGNSFVQTNGTGYGLAGLEAARQAPETISADFALLGGGAANQAFTSLNDLFFSAEDLLVPAGGGGESVGTGSLFGKDANAPVTGSYVKAVGGAWDTSGAWELRGVSNGLVLGRGFPAGAGTWIVAAKSDAVETQELKLTGTTGTANCTFADQTVSLTTSWQVFRIPYNTVTGNGSCDSATGGNPVTATGLPPSGGANVETAWLSFVPAAQQILIANAPTQPNQAANKNYVDTQIASQIVSGGGALPITGGTLTGPLNAPVLDGTTNCALSSSVAACVAGATSALIPPGTTGTYTQNATMQATAQCVYSPLLGGRVTSVVPGQLGLGYTSAPAVSYTGGAGGGLVVTATVSGGQVTGYTVVNGGSGFTSCPSITVAAPPAASPAIPVLDQRRGLTSYSADVRVDDFGCAADGVTDDTQCINDAIQYATQGGTRTGSITFSQGKTYFVGSISGYVQTAWDDGSAPSTDTCGGVACTNLAPETPGYLGYAIRVVSSQSNPLTIYGNGATITSTFNTSAAGAATYTLSAPYFAMFGSDTGFVAWNLYDLNMTNGFIGVATKGGAYWRWDRVSMNGMGIGALIGSSQYDTFRDILIQNSSSGIIIGGWWGTRAPATSPSGGVFLNDENLGDATDVDGILFYGRSWATESQSQIAQNALDSWFNTNFFHVGDNQTRLTDQNLATFGAVTDSMWRGIYHVMFATYSRYLRPVISVTVHNATVKTTQNYPILATAASGWVIDGLTAEDVGWCDGNGAYGAYGSSSCPSPYDSVNNQLPAPVLLYGFHNIYVKNIQVGGNPIVETVAEPQQVSAAQQLSDFRLQLTNLDSTAASALAPRTQPVSTGRLIMGPSNGSYPPGVNNSDSGEICLKGVNQGYPDEWCMRGVEQTYPSSASMPRYLTLENDGYGGFSGLTAVQAPGLRVRPGLISSGDSTQPVTDFAEQAFTISAGNVSGETCATVPGISLPNAVTTDAIPFVKAPAATGQLQLSGTVTAANVFSLTVCNPSTQLQTYPAGTYYAFLLAGATAPSNPAVSGGSPVATNPLTTTEGDLVVGDANGNPTRLGGNVTATSAVLTQSGSGTVANEPVWSTAPAFSGINITGLNAANITTGAVGILNGGTGATTAVGALANLNGASLSAPVSAFAGELTAKQIGGAFQVDQFAGSDIGAQLAACIAGLNAAYGGICDARNYAGTVTMASTLTVSVANTTILLPCATISTSASIVVPAGVRNVTLKGCGLRGASTASGSQGGSEIAYTGSGSAIQVGDPTYAVDTMGFHLDNAAINITGTTSATATGFTAYRTQELDLESLYFLGNGNQAGLTVDGTGNYSGGSFYDLAFNGFQIAVNGIGHQVTNPATTDWMNASLFLRLHIDCPTSGGSPVTGTVGINLGQGDGNTFTGGDVEGCATALHLGANAQNNTLVGVRNENSNSQVVADSGSAYNSWITGGTMFTGALTDNGTRNSFLDTFHRAFNGLNGDWYGSQKDATVTNHFRIGTGAGNERGLLARYQTDFGYRWTMGLSDATAGEQFYQVLDELNSVYRLSIGQYNNGSSNTNNQTVVNAAGSGAVVLNGSNNAGTGGVVFGSGGATETTVATVDGAGDANFTGTLQVSGVTTLAGSVTVKNGADAEIDATLWAGHTTTQKESFIYKDWNGNSQWYMVKDTGNNWALNSAIDSTDHFKAYQNGETMLNSSGTGYVSVNREASSGTGGLVLFSGGTSPTQVAKVDAAGNITNAGTHVSTGNITVLNGANAEADVVVQPGSSADQNGALEFNGYTGTAYWKLKKDASNYLRVSDVANSLDRLVLFQNGNTNLNAGAGANGVAINSSAGTGTGGLLVYSGGSSPAQVAKIDGSGNLTVTSCTGCGGSSGSVTSVGLALPSDFTVTGSPVTGAGTLTGAWTTTPTGTGALVRAGSPTFTGNVTLANGANSAQTLAVQPGNSAEQNGILQFNGYSGTDEWQVKKDATNYLHVTDAVNSLDRVVLYQNGETILNAGAGANVVGINNTSGSGTGGMIVYGGGTNYSVAELTVSGGGNVTANGFVAGKFQLGSGTMSLAAGSAAGTGASFACATSHICDGVSGSGTLTTGTGPGTGTLGTLTFPNTHTNQANCMVSVQLAGTGVVTSVGWSESTTALTLTANVALAASTAYSVRYWCGGN